MARRQPGYRSGGRVAKRCWRFSGSGHEQFPGRCNELCLDPVRELRYISGATREADFKLSFSTPAPPASELSAKRMEPPQVLKNVGPRSTRALAKLPGCNYSNGHADVRRLIEHGLIEKHAADQVLVPRAAEVPMMATWCGSPMPPSDVAAQVGLAKILAQFQVPALPASDR